VNGVYWIYGPSAVPMPSSSGKLGLGLFAPDKAASKQMARLPMAIVLCPRGGRFLQGELVNFKRSGIQTLVSLLSDEQVGMLELDEEASLARRLGMQFLHHPIPDHELPRSLHAFRAFVTDLARRLQGGERMGIHCWGSIGRATVTAACTLIHLGWKPAEALAAIEAARGCPVPDTEAQQRWILNYKAEA
jgi:protein-tyrosine phosphatase